MKTFLQICSVVLLLIVVAIGCDRTSSVKTSKVCACSPHCQCGDCKCKPGACTPNCRDHAGHENAAHDHTGHSSASRNVYAVMMDEMMVEMDRAVTDASVEEDFLAQMLAHHKGALVMAEHEAARGHNAEMVQLAKSIVAEQTGEVQEMEVLLDLVRTSGGTAVTGEYRAAMTKTMTDMMRVLPSDHRIRRTDREALDYEFAALMRPHHQAAIDMAAVVLAYSDEPHITHLAEKIIVAQTVEIEQMDAFIGTKTSTAPTHESHHHAE
ncbi:MAG: DUF305 domain-containing protein [Thermoguttaceae bacterium]